MVGVKSRGKDGSRSCAGHQLLRSVLARLPAALPGSTAYARCCFARPRLFVLSTEEVAPHAGWVRCWFSARKRAGLAKLDSQGKAKGWEVIFTGSLDGAGTQCHRLALSLSGSFIHDQPARSGPGSELNVAHNSR